MKTYFKIFFVLLPALMFAQESIVFTEGSFNEILQKAEKENKLIFLDAYAAWCGPCKLMEKNVFTDKQVASYFNSNFINSHFDMEKGEGRDLAMKYGVRSYPTLLFLNYKGEVVSKSLGYLDANQFISFGTEAKNTASFGSLKERFDKGESSPDFLINVMRENVESDFPLAQKASERYFKVKKSNELTKDDIGLLMYFTKSDQDENYKVFKENKAEILKFIPEETYNSFDANIKLQKVLAESLDQKAGIINDKFYLEKAIPLVGKEQAEKLLNQVKVNFYGSTKNIPEFEKAAIAYYKNPNDFEPTELLRAAWFISENSKDVGSLKKAESWASNAVIRMETAESTYVLAKIYSKIGKNDLAKMYAETSKRIAAQTGADTSAANQLISELK